MSESATDVPDGGTPAEADGLLDKVAIALHDAECHDRKCNGPALGAYYGQARVALDTAAPHIAAAERERLTTVITPAQFRLIAKLLELHLGFRPEATSLRRFADLLAAAPDTTTTEGEGITQ